MLYLTQIDRHNALGLGKDVVIAGDVNSDSFFVVMPQSGQVMRLRVPYPLGFFRSASGRVDEPNAGWKGRRLVELLDLHTWHQEGGKGTRPKIAKFQIRPNALAK
jgi:hypothetical protein